MMCTSGINVPDERVRHRALKRRRVVNLADRSEILNSVTNLRRKNLCRLVITLLGILVPAGLHATTYYVDFAAGLDTNSGTAKTAPWQHIKGMVGCTGNCSSHGPVGGDVVIFKGGVTWTGVFQWSVVGGSSSMVTYTTDHTWFNGGTWSQPIFDDQAAVPPTGPSGGMVNGGGNFITLNDLTFLNCGVAGTFADDECIIFTNRHDIAITNCTFQTHNWISVYFPFTRGTTYSNFTFTGNDVSGTSNGIWFAGAPGIGIHNVNISNNAFHDYHPDMDGGTHGNGFHWYAQPNDGTSYLDGMVFCGNKFYGDFSSLGTYVDEVSGGGMTAFFFFEAPLSGVICNNDFSFINPGAGGSPTFNALINFGYSNGTGHQAKVEIYNNSFVGTGSDVMSAAIDFCCTNTTGDSVTIENNIASGMSTCLQIQDSDSVAALVLSDYNLWNCSMGFHIISSYMNYSKWKSTGRDTHGVLGSSPLWTAPPGNEQLKSGSPAIGAATNLTSLGYTFLDVDQTGAARPASDTWDTGALQFTGPHPPSPPSGLTSTPQ